MSSRNIKTRQNESTIFFITIYIIFLWEKRFKDGTLARQEDKCNEIRSDVAADTGILHWLVDFYQQMQKNVLLMKSVASWGPWNMVSPWVDGSCASETEKLFC